MPRRRLRRPKPLGEETPSDDYKAIFARNLRAARVGAGMRQEDLATKASVSKQYIQKLERGTENTTIDTMKRLSAIAGHSLVDLLRKDFNSTDETPPTEDKSSSTE